MRAIVTAVVQQSCGQLHRIGSAQLAGGRQLIGLDDGLGTRSYLLDLDAYHGSTYRLLRDLGDHLRPSLAYLDRAADDAHLERTLSDLEWEAVSGQFTALDFDGHVGDHGSVRTDWIETVLYKAAVPGGQLLDRSCVPCSATARVGSCPRS